MMDSRYLVRFLLHFLFFDVANELLMASDAISFGPMGMLLKKKKKHFSRQLNVSYFSLVFFGIEKTLT